MNAAIAVGPDCTIGVAWRDSVNNANFDIGTTYLKWSPGGAVRSRPIFRL